MLHLCEISHLFRICVALRLLADHDALYCGMSLKPNSVALLHMFLTQKSKSILYIIRDEGGGGKNRGIEKNMQQMQQNPVLPHNPSSEDAFYGENALQQSET